MEFWNTALGGALAIAGGLVATWVTGRQRQAEERKVWARGLRYEAHVAFLAAFDDLLGCFDPYAEEPYSPGLPWEFLRPALGPFENLRILCTARTASAAQEALDTLHSLAFGSATLEQVDADRQAYVAAIRQEFDLPPAHVRRL